MKNQPQNRIPNAQAGFTLLEIMIALVVFGILCAAVSVSWASFIRYQELREDAAAFHKELLALKAKAVASGNTFTVEYLPNGYQVVETGTDEDGVDIPTTPKKIVKTVNFHNNVAVARYSANSSGTDGNSAAVVPMTGLPVFQQDQNTWNTIVVRPQNLDAFVPGMALISNGTNKYFCVVKDFNSIKPELYYKTGNNPWKKI